MVHWLKVFALLFICINALPCSASDINYAIGLMSGTSMDGIDGTILQTDGKYQIKEKTSDSLRYSKPFHFALKTAEHLARRHHGDVKPLQASDFEQEMREFLCTNLHCTKAMSEPHISSLSEELGTSISFDAIVNHSTKLHAQLVKALLTKSRLKAKQIFVIGYHGQTLLHLPRKLSLQVGNGQDLADLTGITVVNNFRAADIQAGGQGAPFAPLYHQALAQRDNLFPCAVVNNGGIANITLIFGPHYEDVIGFDTGPGNRLIDLFVKKKTRGAETCDRDGHYGAAGSINPRLLAQLMNKSTLQNEKNYFALTPPKSLDSNDLIYIPELDEVDIHDGCATLELFTAMTIAMGAQLIKDRPQPKLWLLAGGGWKNPVILRHLKEKLPGTTVLTVDEQGWNSDSLEAQIFAWMAIRSLKKLPLSIPQTTGVPEPCSGGEIYKPKTILFTGI